ncbi:MAG: sulfurtransferase [Chloroflexota bacterium]
MASDFKTTAWLAEHLDDDNLCIVDIRGHVLPASQPPPHYFSHRDEYNQSHIPNAVFVDWTSDIVDPESPTYDVASPERFATLMSRLGISNDSTVVVYDDANGMFAARFWWVMAYYGHESVFVLEGGWQKWVAENHPTTDTIPAPTETSYTPQINPDLRADLASIEANQPQLIDVRSPAEYAGEASRAQRKGHIPNAINLPRKSLLNADGTLKSTDELKMMFAEAGIQTDAENTVVYCNSGVSASYGLLALRAAGVQKARVYDSSWKEWGNRDDTPIE